MYDPDKIQRELEEELQSASSAEDFEKIRVKYFGKKGLITLGLKSLKELPLEERKRVGTKLNAIKKQYEQEILRKK